MLAGRETPRRILTATRLKVGESLFDVYTSGFRFAFFPSPSPHPLFTLRGSRDS